MKNQRGRVVLLITVLLASVALLAWSVFSTWRQATPGASPDPAASLADAGGNLPPPLTDRAAKAKLFYPVMKPRGPQAGGTLQSKPLMATLPRVDQGSARLGQ
jgi:hypothetical protein